MLVVKFRERKKRKLKYQEGGIICCSNGGIYLGDLVGLTILRRHVVFNCPFKKNDGSLGCF